MSGPVECYSGYEYPQRPQAIWWQGERFEVADIIENRRTPQGKYFRVSVSANDREGQSWFFELFYDESNDTWRVDQV